MQEKHTRRHEKLTQHWEALRGTQKLPQESKIDPSALQDIWDYCFLVSVKHDGRAEDYRYSYLGKALLEVYGYDPSQEGMTQALLDPHSARLLSKLEEVCETGKPVTDIGQFVNNNNVEVRYRSCLLPLSGEKPGEVAFVMGTMDWKGY